MSECSCVPGPDCYESEGFHCNIMRTARKAHECDECCGVIAKGQQYEVSTCSVEGTIFRSKTCSVCIEIRNAFFCDGFLYGETRYYLREHFREIDGIISNDCVEGLSDEAFDVVVGMVEEVRLGIMDREGGK